MRNRPQHHVFNFDKIVALLCFIYIVKFCLGSWKCYKSRLTLLLDLKSKVLQSNSVGKSLNVDGENRNNNCPGAVWHRLKFRRCPSIHYRELSQDFKVKEYEEKSYNLRRKGKTVSSGHFLNK